MIGKERVREMVKIVDKDHRAFEGTKIAAAGSENDGDQLRVEEVMPSKTSTSNFYPVPSVLMPSQKRLDRRNLAGKRSGANERGGIGSNWDLAGQGWDSADRDRRQAIPT